LRGEELDWYRLASHLDMSKQRCQQETTSTEFLDWMEYLKLDVNAFHREDYFLASIARHIRMAFSKDPKKVPRLEQFLLKFTERKIMKKDMTKKETMERMKSQFLGWVGIKRKKE